MPDSMIDEIFDPHHEDLFAQRILFHAYMVSRFGATNEPEQAIKDRVSHGAWTAARGLIDYLLKSGRMNKDLTLPRKSSNGDNGTLFLVGEHLAKQIGFEGDDGKRTLDNVTLTSLDEKKISLEEFYQGSFSHSALPRPQTLINNHQLFSIQRFVIENLVWQLNGRKEKGLISIEWNGDSLVEFSLIALLKTEVWQVLFGSVLRKDGMEPAIYEISTRATAQKAIPLCFATTFHNKAEQLAETVAKIPLIDILDYLKLNALLNSTSIRSMNTVNLNFPEIIHQKGLLHVVSGWEKAISKRNSN